VFGDDGSNFKSQIAYLRSQEIITSAKLNFGSYSFVMSTKHEAKIELTEYVPAFYHKNKNFWKEPVIHNCLFLSASIYMVWLHIIAK
jgi:hypothetical protein